MKRLLVALRNSMTNDRGSEMACHPELARRLKICTWFCDPHAPWQRGINENTNGFLRRFTPKGTDLSDASQTCLNDVAALMKNCPRKTLGWRTPAEAMADELAAFRSTVELEILISLVIGADDYLCNPARQGRVTELVSVHCQHSCCSCDASVVPVPL